MFITTQHSAVSGTNSNVGYKLMTGGRLYLYLHISRVIANMISAEIKTLLKCFWDLSEAVTPPF